MGHAGATEIDDGGQQTVLGQEIRQAGIPVGEARHGRQGGQRVQFGQNVGGSSTEVDIIE